MFAKNEKLSSNLNTTFISILTGQIIAKARSGPVDKASSQCHPNVGITTNAKATSKHAPNAQKH